MKTQKPYLDEQTGERFAEPPSPLPLYLVYLPESNEDDLLSSVQAANFIERELRDGFDAGRVSRDAEVAELKAKIAAAVARLNAASIPPMMTEAQFNATTITDARRILLGSASSPVEGGN